MTSFETSSMDCTVTEYFERIVRAYSTNIAIQSVHLRWSYDDLNQRANQIAHTLVQQGGSDKGQVAIFCENIAWQIAALLAVLKTGQTVVILDTGLPDERLQFILADAQVHAVLVDAALAERANALTHRLIDSPPTVIHADRVPIDCSCLNLAQPINKDDLCAIIYTSGSTGSPKGVTRTHCLQMHNVWRYYQRADFHPNPRGGIFASLAYAATFGMVLRLLLCGGCVCEFDLKTEGIQDFARWLDRESITFINPPISLIRQWCNILEQPVHLPHLQRIELVGAIVNKADLRQLRTKIIGSYTIVLVYGSTELLNVTNYQVDDVDQLPEGALPAGYHTADKPVLIVDEQGSPVQTGQIGEIVIQSRYLNKGYWRRSALTQEKFTNDPQNPSLQLFFTGDLGYQEPDGCLWITGRKDLMVKIRGYQVDLTEVEQSILAISEIQNAVVVAHEIDPLRDAATSQAVLEKELVAYVVCHPQCKLTQSQLRQHLGKQLPAYMLPNRFIQLAALPLTPTGKVDRQALPVPDNSRLRERFVLDTVYHPARTALEQKLTTIWEEVLSVQPVGINDHFLDLGGNSLRAMQVHARLLNQVQIDLPTRLLFECATIAEMALLVTQQHAAEVDQTELAQLLTALETMPNDALQKQ